MDAKEINEAIVTLLNSNAAAQQRVKDALRQIQWELHWVEFLRAELGKRTRTRKRGRMLSSTKEQLLLSEFPNGMAPGSSPGKKVKWSLTAQRRLSAIVERLAIQKGASPDPSIWNEVARAVLRQCGVVRTGIECFQEYARLHCDKRDFTPAEKKFLHASIAARPNDWRALSEELYANFGLRRTPFQIAQQCRQLTSKLFYESHLPVEKVWARIEPFVHFPDTDCYRITAMVNSDASARACLPLSPNSVKYALKYGFFNQGGRALYWKVTAILCNFFTPYKGLFQLFQAKSHLAYSQISLEELACHSNSSLEDLRTRIVQKLLEGREGLLNADFEQISKELFGHDRVALSIFREASHLLPDDERP